jgi:hypothetical protein
MNSIYAYDPSPGENLLLALITLHESSGNPKATNLKSSATGLFQFIRSTWESVCLKTGVDSGLYPRAMDALPELQRINALWLLRRYGPNSKYSWAASGPYPTAEQLSWALAHRA